jgi:hypothetical protein
MSAAMASRRFWICLLGAAGIALCVEGSAYVVAHRVAQRAGGRWTVKLRERERYETLQPAPTKENADRIEVVLSEARMKLAQATEKLSEDETAAATEESGRLAATDVFFDLAAFAARMRQQAEQAGVALPAEGSFGFSAYAEEPPPAELASRVLRQRRFAEIVLRMLFEAGPESLVSFQRDMPSIAIPERRAVSGGPRPAQKRERVTTDIFVLDPQLALRRSGIVERAAFRLVFTGATGALRALLNALAAARLPIVVRSVEVERTGNAPAHLLPQRTEQPASITLGAAVAHENSAVAAPVPVVMPAASRFTVILEIVQFTDDAENKAPGEPPVFG